MLSDLKFKKTSILKIIKNLDFSIASGPYDQVQGLGVIVFFVSWKYTIRYIPENISIKSTLNKIQYSTQLILVLNQYFKKVLKFKSILVLFHINILNVLNQH
jgi:hypothetical protein